MGAVLLLLALAGAGVLYQVAQRWNHAHADGNVRSEETAGETLVELAAAPATIRVSAAGMKSLGIETARVAHAPPPEPLRLSGSLLLDPNRLVRIHARFPGELVSLGMVPVDPAENGAAPWRNCRPLQYGDKVVKNQLLAVVWSKDIGEKKSELIDAISKRDIDRKVLAQIRGGPGRHLGPHDLRCAAQLSGRRDRGGPGRTNVAILATYRGRDPGNPRRSQADSGSQAERSPRRSDLGRDRPAIARSPA